MRRYLGVSLVGAAAISSVVTVLQQLNLLTPNMEIAAEVSFGVILIFIVVWRCAAAARRMEAERDEAQGKIVETRRNSEDANRIKSAFLANMSHEIRTPLTAIVGFADLYLGGERSGEEKQDFVRTIRRNGEHLLTIINDILDLSKIEAGRM